jgi:CcmD family protein
MIEFFAQHQLYIVLTIVLLVWVGIVVYLLRLDRKLATIEKMLRKE